MNSHRQLGYVLDSFAILCWLNNEHGADKVADLLIKSKKQEIRLFMNWINIGEIYYIVQRKDSRKKAIETVLLIKQLPITRVECEEALILLAGDYKAKYSLSYADACCVATAISKEAKVVTGDSEYKSIKDEMLIEWLPLK